MDGVPVSAWLSGVWYHKDALAAAGIEEPHNWEQLLKASQALNEPAKNITVSRFQPQKAS